MDLKDLSSNWKKLQTILEKDTSTPSKRKASEGTLHPQRNGVKRPKVAPSMGFTTSRPSESRYSEPPFTNTKPPASLALWAEDNDIAPADLASAYGFPSKPTSPSEIRPSNDKINEGLSLSVEAGRYVAIDCEMVGVGPNPASDSALARVSMVNFHGCQLYDSFVLPKEKITDYRTRISGITASLLRSARTLNVVQADVAKLLNGKILVGHAVQNDLDALMLSHPRRDIRDTSRYPDFRQLSGGRTPSLKRLAKEVLGLDIQEGEHSSVEDAMAAMLLFKREKSGFEREHMKKWGTDRKVLINNDGTRDYPKRTAKKKRKKK